MCRPGTGAVYLHELATIWRVFRDLLSQHIRITNDGGQDIVEVVSYTPSQLADRLHLLGLEELSLKLLAFGHVSDDTLVANNCSIFVPPHGCR